MIELYALFRQDIQCLRSKTLQIFMTAALLDAPLALSVDEAAERAEVSRQAVAKQLRQEEMRRPRWYISGARLVHAAWLLERQSHAVKFVAQELRFQQPPDLYNMFANYTGVTLPILREYGIQTFVENWYRIGLRSGSQHLDTRIILPGQCLQTTESFQQSNQSFQTTNFLL